VRHNRNTSVADVFPSEKSEAGFMATIKAQRMKVTHSDGSSDLHPLPNIPAIEKINEHMLGLSKRGVLFPKATNFEVVTVDVDADTLEPVLPATTQENLNVTQ
jgi:hypothetical protein